MNGVHTLLHTHKTHEWNVINLFSVLYDVDNSKEFYYYLISSRDGFRSFNGTFYSLIMEKKFGYDEVGDF